MAKTLPPLRVVPFEDRLAPAVLLLTPAGTSWLGAIRTFLQTHHAADGPQQWSVKQVAATQTASMWLFDETPTRQQTKVPEATRAADLGPVPRTPDSGPGRDSGSGTASRGSSSGPTANPATIVSALPTQTAGPAPVPESAAPAANRPAQTTAGPIASPATAAGPVGRVAWAGTDYVFLETESTEPPPAAATEVPPPTEPLEPDVPQIVPAVADEPVVAAEPVPATPLAGLLPFNLGDLEGTAHDLLARVGGIGTDLVEDLETGSEYAWLGVGALAAAGAVYASRPTRRPRARTGPDGYDSVFARWEGADAAPPR